MRRSAFLATAALFISGLGPAVPAGSAEGGSGGYIPLGAGSKAQYWLETPAGDGPFPTLLTYDPYYAGTSFKASLVGAWGFMVEHGYAVIGVNIPGTGCSPGKFMPPDAETWGRQGAEVVEWVARQPWSDGNVGMGGASFPGLSQLGVAGFNPPHLRAIAPWDATADWYRDVFYPGGIRNIVWPKQFGFVVQPGFAATGTVRSVADGDTDCAALAPQEQAARAAGNFGVESERHPYFDDFWARAPITRIDNIDVPVLGCQSWHDSAVGSRTAELYTAQAPHPDRTWFVGTNGQHGSCLPSDAEVVRFMDRYVKGENNGWEETPHLRLGHDIPVGEVNPPYEREPGPPAAWFSAPAGGVSAVTPVTLHLHPDGTMHSSPPAGRGSLSYHYPLPSSSSGQFLMAEPGEMSGWHVYNAPGGSLSYTTPALAHDVEVFGPASADLWISSTATDTDLQVTVTEVRPDGQEQWIQRGWLRLSHRALDPARSTALRPYHTHQQADAAPLKPGAPVPARVEVMPFGHVFRAGSSIRFTVEAPTGVTLGHRFDYLKNPAENTLHHGSERGSRLVLGVIPGSRARKKPLPACNTVNMEPCRANMIPVPAGRLSLER